MLFTHAQRLKFRLLAEGMAISPAARRRLDELRGGRRLTPADYASTSGVILRLGDDVWVNAAVADHNPNFVSAPRNSLDWAAGGFFVSSAGLESPAAIWLPPSYHDQRLADGRPMNDFAFSHGDRVRLAPISGCAMRCTFCNIPYEDPYATKPIASMIEVLERAFSDPLQPAHHVLISGGTPVARDVGFLSEVYERVLLAFPGRWVDVMMVPVEGLFDLPRLARLGLHELWINVELHGTEAAAKLMPQKHRKGLGYYLDFIGEAASELGPGRVRSILMVGLESADETVAGARAVLQAGGSPVLSPFRPHPATPLFDVPPWSAEQYEEVFLRCSELAADFASELGPSCPPCTHNTLALAGKRSSEVRHPKPRLHLA